MFYVVSPPERVDWNFDRTRLAELLRRDWPGIEVSSERQIHDAFDVVWKYRSAGEELEGSQERAGQAQYLEGPLHLIARYAAWWRGQVAAEQPLILYDESYSTIIPLPPGIEAESVLRELES